MTTSVVVVVAVGTTLFVLFHPRVRRSRTWRATVTPLASIIGSGFLVVAPLLAALVGRWAPVAMAAIVAAAFAVGWVMRHNIRWVEPRLHALPPVAHTAERLSNVALGLAYVVAVAFYTRLLASFLLRPLIGEMDLAGRVVAATIVATIGWIGWVRGFDGLERIEEPAVNLKLGVIVGLIAGLLVHDVTAAALPVPATLGGAAIDVARKLAGMLIVVQGFETSRYLGAEFDATTRIRTMRLAQFLSGAIYVVFIAAAVPVFGAMPTGHVSETAILDIARVVTPVLVPLLLAGAVASQLTAAVADTVGGGGMLHEAIGLAHPRFGYMFVAAGALLVVATTNVFAIVTLASRAFALYYLLQSVVSASVAADRGAARDRAAAVAVAVLMGFVVLVGEPVA